MIPFVRPALACALLASAGCDVPAPPAAPVAPSIDGLLDRFDTVDGTLDAAAAEQLIEDAVGDVVLLGLVAALMTEMLLVQQGFDQATSESLALTAAGDAPADAPTDEAAQGLIGESHHALNTEVGGWARLTHVCSGLTPEVVDQSKGLLRMQTVLETLDLAGQPVVLWGTAEDCALDAADGTEARLDADIVGAWNQVDGQELILQVLGNVAGIEDASDFDLEIQYTPPADPNPARYDIRRTVDGNGSFLIGLAELDAETTTVTIRDAGGVWSCSFDADQGSGECSQGDEVLQWL